MGLFVSSAWPTPGPVDPPGDPIQFGRCSLWQLLRTTSPIQDVVLYLANRIPTATWATTKGLLLLLLPLGLVADESSKPARDRLAGNPPRLLGRRRGGATERVRRLRRRQGGEYKLVARHQALGVWRDALGSIRALKSTCDLQVGLMIGPPTQFDVCLQISRAPPRHCNRCVSQHKGSKRGIEESPNKKIKTKKNNTPVPQHPTISHCV